MNLSKNQKTIKTLRHNDYDIREFVLGSNNTKSMWHYYHPADEQIYLQYRRTAID